MLDWWVGLGWIGARSRKAKERGFGGVGWGLRSGIEVCEGAAGVAMVGIGCGVD